MFSSSMDMPVCVGNANRERTSKGEQEGERTESLTANQKKCNADRAKGDKNSPTKRAQQAGGT